MLVSIVVAIHSNSSSIIAAMKYVYILHLVLSSTFQPAKIAFDLLKAAVTIFFRPCSPPKDSISGAASFSSSSSQIYLPFALSLQLIIPSGSGMTICDLIAPTLCTNSLKTFIFGLILRSCAEKTAAVRSKISSVMPRLAWA